MDYLDGADILKLWEYDDYPLTTIFGITTTSLTLPPAATTATSHRSPGR